LVALLVRGFPAGDENDAREPAGADGRFREVAVPEVDGIEGAAE
jgi:hypothetical protein